MKKIIKMFLAACIAVNLVRAMNTPLPPEPDYGEIIKQINDIIANNSAQLSAEDVQYLQWCISQIKTNPQRIIFSNCESFLRKKGLIFTTSILQDLLLKARDFFSELPHQALQSAAENYFKEIFKVDTRAIEFSHKRGGIQLGNTIRITKDDRVLRFYCKTHSEGSTSETRSLSTKPVDVDELIVYKFLEHLGVGPKTHFFFNDEKNFYIATQDIGQYDDGRPDDEVLTYEQVRSDAQLIGCSLETFSKEQEQLVNPIVTRALVVIDVISRIFGLSDAITNPGNFCFTKNKASQTLTGFKLIDFRNAGGIPRKEEIFEGFKKGNGAYNYPTSKDPLIKHFLADKDMQERRTLVLQYLNPGQMLSILDIVKTEIEPIVSLLNSKESYLGNLEKHIRYIRENIEAFFADLGKIGE